MTEPSESETDHSWGDVERLFGDLDRDGYEVESIRSNANPVSGDKKLIIEVSEGE